MIGARPFTIELSELDLQRFGVVTAQAHVFEAGDVVRCDAFCHANGVQLLIVRCPGSAMETVQAFEREEPA